MLANETACQEAEEMALAITPDTELADVERHLQETDDAYVLTAGLEPLPLGGCAIWKTPCAGAQAGASLQPAELLKIAGLLRSLRAILDWRSRSEGVSVSINWRFEAYSPINTWKKKSSLPF